VENYKIQIKPSALKELEKLPKKILSQLVKRIQNLKKNPTPPGCEKLTGQDHYRIRQGNYRAVYSINNAKSIVDIVKIGHRKEIYRQKS